MNDCKGHGGCGEHPGENACKGKGACEVPLSDKTWPKARKQFEALMTKAGKSSAILHRRKADLSSPLWGTGARPPSHVSGSCESDQPCQRIDIYLFYLHRDPSGE